ncbi:MAG: AAA family ATPase [Oscillospiraceae bacterium]|nr:AAA family ATPase [Oscillospiraceae bacterium]
MGRVIAITSGKGGTGKTTTAAAVASCLAALGHRTLAVDCDAGLRNLDVSLGMSEFIVADISDVADARLSLGEAAREHPGIPNLFFLSAPAGRAPSELGADAMARLFDEARESYEYVLADSPAGLGTGFNLASASADSAIVVSMGDKASVRGAAKTADTLRAMGTPDTRLLINRLDGGSARRLGVTADDIIDLAGARLIGIVRESRDVQDAVTAETPLVLFARGGAARDFLDVARRLRGEEIPI